MFDHSQEKTSGNVELTSKWIAQCLVKISEELTFSQEYEIRC